MRAREDETSTNGARFIIIGVPARERGDFREAIDDAHEHSALTDTFVVTLVVC